MVVFGGQLKKCTRREPHGPNRDEPKACIADDDIGKIYRNIVYVKLEVRAIDFVNEFRRL